MPTSVPFPLSAPRHPHNTMDNLSYCETDVPHRKIGVKCRHAPVGLRHVLRKACIILYVRPRKFSIIASALLNGIMGVSRYYNAAHMCLEGLNSWMMCHTICIENPVWLVQERTSRILGQFSALGTMKVISFWSLFLLVPGLDRPSCAMRQSRGNPTSVGRRRYVYSVKIFLR